MVTSRLWKLWILYSGTVNVNLQEGGFKARSTVEASGPGVFGNRDFSFHLRGQPRAVAIACNVLRVA